MHKIIQTVALAGLLAGHMQFDEMIILHACATPSVRATLAATAFRARKSLEIITLNGAERWDCRSVIYDHPYIVRSIDHLPPNVDAHILHIHTIEPVTIGILY